MVAPPAGILARPPPSTSGPGRHPFKVVMRVRIPLGASGKALRRDSLVDESPREIQVAAAKSSDAACEPRLTDRLAGRVLSMPSVPRVRPARGRGRPTGR